MTAVDPGEIALCQQLLFSFQPVLYVVTGLRWNKVIGGLVQVVSRCEPCSIFEFSALLMRMSVVFHKTLIDSINGL